MIQDGLMYRLHKLAEVGYCAQFGRHRDGYVSVRLSHPDPRNPELVLDSNGYLTNFGAAGADVPCDTPDHRAVFDAFVSSVASPRLGYRSLFVHEAKDKLVGHSILYAFIIAIAAIAAFAIQYFNAGIH